MKGEPAATQRTSEQAARSESRKEGGDLEETRAETTVENAGTGDAEVTSAPVVDEDERAASFSSGEDSILDLGDEGEGGVPEIVLPTDGLELETEDTDDFFELEEEGVPEVVVEAAGVNRNVGLALASPNGGAGDQRAPEETGRGPGRGNWKNSRHGGGRGRTQPKKRLL